MCVALVRYILKELSVCAKLCVCPRVVPCMRRVVHVCM